MDKRIILVILLVMMMSLSTIAVAAEDQVVAVVDLTNNTSYHLPQIGEMAAEALGVMISRVDGFTVVERANQEAILAEHRLALSGLVDNQDEAIQIGKLLGANYLVTGSITNITEERTTFEGYGVKTTKIEVTVDVSLKLIDINTGALEVAGLYSTSKIYEDRLPSNLASAVRDLLKNTYRQFISEITELATPTVDPDQTISVDFTSTPEGADIEVDGIYMGSTPASIPLTGGVHQVRLSLAGYEVWEKQVMVFAGLAVKVTLEERGEDE